MNIPSWANTYPRLCELYLESELGHQNNYFEHKNLRAALLRQPPELYYINLEQVLNLMDSDAWSEFKKKTKPYVTVKDRWGWHTQIFERFHEARGYAFLKQQGYSKVHFIPEKPNQRTPDLWGTGNQGVALLEAKRIRDSDKENDELVMSMEQRIMPMYEGASSLPEALKEKLNSTAQVAKEQLNNYELENVSRRILFLSIRLDLNCATNMVKQQIEQYLSQFEADIEIVHGFENNFFPDDQNG